MKKNKYLVITDISPELKSNFEDIADGLHLSKSQFLQLLLNESSFSTANYPVFNDMQCLKEWRDALFQNFFRIAHH